MPRVEPEAVDSVRRALRNAERGVLSAVLRENGDKEREIKHYFSRLAAEIKGANASQHVPVVSLDDLGFQPPEVESPRIGNVMSPRRATARMRFFMDRMQREAAIEAASATVQTNEESLVGERALLKRSLGMSQEDMLGFLAHIPCSGRRGKK
eukprot:Hpha_TRINITY_DN27909_c0_g1::TRINITY_DN27909_c0_g1_i1::g.44946::m.44946